MILSLVVGIVCFCDLEFKFDVVALSETWNPENKKQNVIPPKIDGYHEYLGTNGSSANGGCGFYINDALNKILRNDLNTKSKEESHESERCWVEIIQDKEPNILLGVCYRHPTKKDTNFTHLLIKTLQNIRKENKKIIVTGDFNFDFLQYDKNDEINYFLNSMLVNNLQPCSTEPSRIVDSCRPSLVDNIFINTLDNPICGNFLENLSYDHLPNFIIIESKSSKK